MEVSKVINTKISGKDKIYHSYMIKEGEDFWVVMYMNSYIVTVSKNHSPIEDLKVPEHIKPELKKFMANNSYK